VRGKREESILGPRGGKKARTTKRLVHYDIERKEGKNSKEGGRNIFAHERSFGRFLRKGKRGCPGPDSGKEGKKGTRKRQEGGLYRKSSMSCKRRELRGQSGKRR